MTGPAPASPECVFCRIAAGEVPSSRVLEDDLVLAFLDTRPVFPGHCLVIPRDHHVTLTDLPVHLVAPLFWATQRLARAVEDGLGADGSFVGVNNRVSQSVAHLHVHVVPRRRKDGLRGFFWPRQRYESDQAMAEVAERLRRALASG
ncbi:MAG: HIT family protein [Acidimicrobiales bacterium]